MIEEVLKKYADIIEKNYKSKLSDNRASGKLINSVKVETDGHLITIKLEDYWKYLEEGRKPGKFPPINQLISWIAEKNIQPKPYTLPNRKQVVPTEKQLAFLIGRAIKEKGIEPEPDLQETLDEVINNLVRDLAKATAKDIADKIRLTINKQPNIIAI